MVHSAADASRLLAKRAEPRAQLGGVKLRLLPGGEVAAAVDLVVLMRLVASGRLDPTIATHRFALRDTMGADDTFADAATGDDLT